jgi:hypothetical protein
MGDATKDDKALADGSAAADLVGETPAVGAPAASDPAEGEGDEAAADEADAGVADAGDAESGEAGDGEATEQDAPPDDGGPTGAGLSWKAQRAEIAEEPGNHGRFALGCALAIVIVLAVFFVVRLYVMR